MREAFVTNEKFVLCQYSPFNGKFAITVQEILKSYPKRKYCKLIANNQVYYWLHSECQSYFVLCDYSYSELRAFRYLQTVRTLFTEEIALENPQNKGSYSHMDFSQTLSKIMDQYQTEQNVEIGEEEGFSISSIQYSSLKKKEKKSKQENQKNSKQEIPQTREPIFQPYYQSLQKAYSQLQDIIYLDFLFFVNNEQNLMFQKSTLKKKKKTNKEQQLDNSQQNYFEALFEDPSERSSQDRAQSINSV